MELIVIGIYDDATHARSAMYELVAAGFPRSDVQLNPGRDPAAAESPPAQKENIAPVSGSIANFFESIVVSGDKSTYSNVYAEAVRRGSSVLTVDVDNDERRRLAEEVMRRHGPVDIEERSGDWVRHGWIGHDPQAKK